MEVALLSEEEVIAEAGRDHNAPTVRHSSHEVAFQSEVRSVYCRLVQTLSEFGDEGDYYGVSDFAVRPDLRDRASVKAPPAPHVRHFALTILSRKFYESPYLKPLHHFLLKEAPEYRIEIAQDFEPSWYLTIYLMTDLAQLFCTDVVECSRLNSVLCSL